MGNDESSPKGADFKKFATPRIIGGIAIAIIVLWALSLIFGSTDDTPSKNEQRASHDTREAAPHAAGDEEGDHGDTSIGDENTDDHVATDGHVDSETVDTATSHDASAGQVSTDRQHTAASHDAAEDEKTGHDASAEREADSHAATKAVKKETAHKATSHTSKSDATDHIASKDAKHDEVAGHPLPETVMTPAHKPTPKGVAFVEASIAPLRYELEERWWGWRPNDLIRVTDNVNNFQMGVLEVSRRTVVALAERISRTGTTDAYDENLEQAMNWLMVKASSYWFPSAESKYKEALEEMEVYLEKLKNGGATFYTRTDNLIPLLASFEDLLGSCDENLVKTFNEDGTPVSFFAVDNYFYYTQGVASSMATILEAVHHDFLLTLESRHGTELLHHAIVSCQRAAEIEPWIILDRKYSSIFANHRANMAAPISHARFYLGQLIKTLST